ncbi:protein of unknown function [Pararobbsia alpina]
MSRADGVRLAEPGESTRRAFLDDKFDLAQAEVVAYFIKESSYVGVQSTRRPLDDVLSKTVYALVDDVIVLRMLVEDTPINIARRYLKGSSSADMGRALEATRPKKKRRQLRYGS